jgi:hypothetical protein
MKQTTSSKRHRGIVTPSQVSRLADQKAAAAANRTWHEQRATAAEKRVAAAAKARREAGPRGGRLRALALLAGALGDTPVTRAAVSKVDRDRRGRALPIHGAKDRSLPGKARIRARRAARR